MDSDKINDLCIQFESNWAELKPSNGQNLTNGLPKLHTQQEVNNASIQGLPLQTTIRHHQRLHGRPIRSSRYYLQGLTQSDLNDLYAQSLIDRTEYERKSELLERRNMTKRLTIMKRYKRISEIRLKMLYGSKEETASSTIDSDQVSNLSKQKFQKNCVIKNQFKAKNSINQNRIKTNNLQVQEALDHFQAELDNLSKLYSSI